MCRTVSLELVMLAVWMFSLLLLYISVMASQLPFMTSLKTTSLMDWVWLGPGSEAFVLLLARLGGGDGWDAMRVVS